MRLGAIEPTGAQILQAGLQVGIKELRDGLSRYLDRVRQGGTITVTDHGRPIARIRPVGRLTTYEQMKLDGRITPARRPKGPAPDPVELIGGGTISEFVAEQRGPLDDDLDEPQPLVPGQPTATGEIPIPEAPPKVQRRPRTARKQPTNPDGSPKKRTTRPRKKS